MVHLNDISNLLTTVWDGLVVSPLTESNSRAVSKFIGDVFVKEAEPFGVAVGFTGQERYSCIERIVM